MSVSAADFSLRSFNAQQFKQKAFNKFFAVPVTGTSLRTGKPIAANNAEYIVLVAGQLGEFTGGEYIFLLGTNEDYPSKPPNLLMALTPNGILEPGKNICIGIGTYHPEMWTPALGLLGFFNYMIEIFFNWCHGEVDSRGIGWIRERSRDTIIDFAAKSRGYNLKHKYYSHFAPFTSQIPLHPFFARMAISTLHKRTLSEAELVQVINHVAQVQNKDPKTLTACHPNWKTLCQELVTIEDDFRFEFLLTEILRV